ncbi:MAG: hypothetical protein AVDCRST_MAG89-1485, partial [uncultured Gemmatimonadetes bacterium]
ERHGSEGNGAGAEAVRGAVAGPQRRGGARPGRHRAARADADGVRHHGGAAPQGSPAAGRAAEEDPGDQRRRHLPAGPAGGQGTGGAAAVRARSSRLLCGAHARWRGADRRDLSGPRGRARGRARRADGPGKGNGHRAAPKAGPPRGRGGKAGL